MKVLHVSTYDKSGGAAIAAYRLHKSLLRLGIDSKMLVQEKSSGDPSIIGPTSKVKKLINLVRPTLDNIIVKLYKNRSKTLFSPAIVPSNIVKKINEEAPEIVHLHWISGGMMTIESLKKIKAPIVWTLHDMWAFTGGEHYDEGQNHFMKKCGNSIVLKSNFEFDLSRIVFLRKKKVFSKLKSLTVIAPSKWMSNCASKSTLLKNRKIICIPNPLDTTFFRPLNKVEFRELYNFPENKKIILFGAVNAIDDDRKGYKELIESLKILYENYQNFEIVVFGAEQPVDQNYLKFPIKYLGKIKDNYSLVGLYNAVDLMIVPSKQECFGQTASEAMSCGTPVVAFDTTGLKDIVDHKENGYLAKPFDSKDLANGIIWVLKNENYYNLSSRARNKAVSSFSDSLVVKEIASIYMDILKS